MAKTNLKALAPLPRFELADRAANCCCRLAFQLVRLFDRLGTLASDRAQGGVVGDLKQPGPKRALPPEAVEAVKGAQKGVLADVLCIPRAHHPRRDPEHDVAVALDQSLERCKLAGLGPADELGIGVHLTQGSWQR